MPTLTIASQNYEARSEKITTPSIILANSGSTYYIPLFSGNYSNGSVVKYGDYNYTLGKLKVGDYRAAMYRELANRSPEIKLISATNNVEYGNGTATCSIYVEVSDKDNDTLTVKFYKRKIVTLSGHSGSTEDTLLHTETVSNTSSGKTVSYGDTFEYSSYENTSGYGYKVEVTDGKATSYISGFIPKKSSSGEKPQIEVTNTTGVWRFNWDGYYNRPSNDTILIYVQKNIDSSATEIVSFEGNYNSQMYVYILTKVVYKTA